MNILPPSIIANSNIAAAQPSQTALPNLPLTSPEALIKALGITQTRTVPATVVASGLIDKKILAQLNSSSMNLGAHGPQTLAARQASAPNTPPTPTTSPAPANPAFWLKLAVAKAGSILILAPAADTGIPPKATPALPSIGTKIPITLSPSGQIELALPNTKNPSARLSNTAPATPIAANHHYPHTAGNNTKPATTAISRTQLDAPADLQTKLSAIQSAVGMLNNNLRNQSGGTTPPSQTFNHIQQLQQAVAQTTPVIQKQLLPNKLAEKLTALLHPNQVAAKTPEDSIAAVKHALGIANSHPLITQLQQTAGITQQLTQGANTTANILATLLKGLPSSTSSHEQVQESRAAIAQWLNQELNGQLTRLARQQVANASHFIERNDAFQHQQEIPLKLGDEFTTAQLRIEEKQEPEHKGHTSKAGKEITKRWAVFLTFEIPPSPHQQLSKSELSVEMALAQEAISIEFWCSDPALQKEVQAKTADLKEDLTASGITVDSLAIHNGQAPNKRTAVSQTRIDLKT